MPVCCKKGGGLYKLYCSQSSGSYKYFCFTIRMRMCHPLYRVKGMDTYSSTAYHPQPSDLSSQPGGDKPTSHRANGLSWFLNEFMDLCKWDSSRDPVVGYFKNHHPGLLWLFRQTTNTHLRARCQTLIKPLTAPGVDLWSGWDRGRRAAFLSPCLI